MSIICSPVKTFYTKTNERLQALLLYPKLVLFEDTQNFYIINIEDKSNEEPNHPDQVYSLEHEIIDKILQDHLLWLTLKSGELVVIDILKGDQIKIRIDNYKIHRLRTFDSKLFLLSESGECLSAPYNTQELTVKLGEGTTELNVCLEKTRKLRSDLEYNTPKTMNGLQIYTDAGNIIIKCPLTGTLQVLSASMKIDEVTPWGDIAILSNQSNMYLLDLIDSNIVFEFKNLGATYYPLETVNSRFYYLVCNKKEVNICCAWDASTPIEDHYTNDSSINKSTIKQSSQEVLKSQMQVLVDAALSAAEPAQVMNQLKNFIDKIEDFGFLIDNASKLCQYDTIYKSILYPLQKHVFLNGDSKLLNLLADLMIKVDMLEYIHFRGNKCYDKINLFDQNVKELCIIFISNSDLDLASICWLKYSEMKMKLIPDDVMDILNTIPHNIKMSGLIIWLRNFTPPLLDQNPYFIDIFVKWTTQRIFLLEQSGYWPKIGLKFIDEIVTVLDRSLTTISIRPISMDDLNILKDHINYIMELKEKYKINMLLGEISSQSPNEVALIMLRRCYTEDLSAFVQDYLPIFATRYLFELDDTLRTYIESEAATCGGGIDSSRLKIFLNAFRSPTSKLDCLLQVLKVLDVPWDATVLDLAVVAAASVYKDFTVTDTDRILAQEIQKELNYAKVKVVLKKYNFPLTCTDYSIVLHKLINAATVDLNDMKVVTSVMTAYTNYGNVLYIDRCLRDCDTRVALDFFNNLSNKEKRILLKTIMTKYEQIINGNTNDTVMERNYLDFLKGTQSLNEIEMNSMENLYQLKNSYNIVLNMNTMYIESSCSDAANTWIQSDGITASSCRGGCVTQLTRTHESRHSVLVTLLRRTSTSNQARKLVESLIMSLPNEENNTSDDIVLVLSHFKDGRNSDLLVDSFEVLIELVTTCVEEHLHYVIKYLSILNTLINASIVVKNLSVIWKLHYIFLPMSSVTATNDYIDLYINTSSPNNFDNIFVNILNISDFMVFRILGNMLGKSAISGKPLCDDYFEVKYRATLKLISKITASHDLDEILLTSLLLVLNGVEEIKDKTWILDTLQGPNDSLPLGIKCYLSYLPIRRAFALDDILPGNTVSYPPQYMLKSKFNINLTDIALPDSSDETWDVKVVLFYVLRQYPNTSFERLVELCRTLNVSVNDGLSLQLISLLTTWELKYKVCNDDLGCRQVYLENDEKDIISKCFSIWESIDDKDFLRDVLNDFWKNGEVTLHGRQISVNPYYYEVYVCIYHLLYGSTVESRNRREYFLLNFLKDYKRKSAPKQYEFELFSVKGMFPEIGHYRLPFHLFMREDMWANLKSEITLETYERWLPAVALLSLDADLQTAKDMICSNALKQTMTSRKRNEVTDEHLKENEPWRLATREEPLLRAAHRCVRHIANMEWAGACLFYVLQGCARGADQVAAAQLCYQFAQRWAALQPGNRAVRQMERLHSTLSTRHALQKIEWACEEFVRLSNEPAQLIRALYLHPNFVEKMARHDVNRAANEIADKNGINISSIRIEILENILARTNKENKSNRFCGLDTKELLTAKYILKATCPKMGAIYLSRIVIDDESDFDKGKKLRALQCLMSVVEPDTAVKVTNRERDALWSSLIELLYIINLENIDMPWVVSTFLQDKICALEHLLAATGTNNVEGLKIAADLARRFGNMKIIKELIPLLLRATLYEEMIPLLLKLSSPPDDIIYTAWRTVILSPFQRADYPITERQKTKCLNALNLLPVCPIIKDEDLIEIWKNCVRCKCFGLGCLVLPYITHQKRQSMTELQKIDRRNLIASLKNLHSETYLVSGAMYVVENMTPRICR